MGFYKNFILKPPLIKGRDHPGDGRFNCNGKAVLSGLTRELTVNAEKKGDTFELTTQTKLTPEARPIDFVFRYSLQAWKSKTLFARLFSEWLTFGM